MTSKKMILLRVANFTEMSLAQVYLHKNSWKHPPGLSCCKIPRPYRVEEKKITDKYFLNLEYPECNNTYQKQDKVTGSLYSVTYNFNEKTLVTLK